MLMKRVVLNVTASSTMFRTITYTSQRSDARGPKSAETNTAFDRFFFCFCFFRTLVRSLVRVSTLFVSHRSIRLLFAGSIDVLSCCRSCQPSRKFVVETQRNGKVERGC